MDLLDRLLGHDAWTTQQLLSICGALSDEQLDHEFDIGHRTLRATLDHIIYNMEAWSSLMVGEGLTEPSDRTIPGMIERLKIAQARLGKTARWVAADNAWDELWTDPVDDPPTEKTYGASIAHIITHSMHHRAQLL